MCIRDRQEPVAEPPVAAAPVEEVQEPEDFADDGVTPLDANGRPLSRNFYFGYDEAILNPADLAALEMHAQILRRNADKRVVIEGHCDERGTREYNLALGESCLLYTSPSPRDKSSSRMPSSA